MKFLLAATYVSGVAAASALPRHDSNPSFNWENTDFVLAFGDSYTFVQGTHGDQNFSFIGDAQKFSFTPSDLLTNEIVQNQLGTSAGGPNWIEYLTHCLSGSPLNCTTQLWDFAFAGADISSVYTAPHHNFTVPLVDQITQWSKYAKPVLKVDTAKALVAVWIGINDISDSSRFKFPTLNATDFPSLYKEIIGAEFAALEAVYKAGYRNFLFMNLPPLDRTPGAIVAGPKAALPNTTMVQTWNSLIASFAADFSSKHHGSEAMVFDTYTYLNGILDNPLQYGFSNTTGFCARYDAPDISTNYAAYGCQPIEKYFWYNSGHITWKVHQYLAEALRGFLLGQ